MRPGRPLLVLLALAGGCGPVNAHWSAPIMKSQPVSPFNAETLAISEAALRYIIRDYDAQQDEARPSCIGLGHHEYRWRVDPPAALMRRLANLDRPVLPISQCPKRRRTKHAGGGGVDSPAGMAFYLEAIDCRSRTACRVRVQYNGGFDDHADHSLSLEKRSGWIVVKNELRGIT